MAWNHFRLKEPGKYACLTPRSTVSLSKTLIRTIPDFPKPGILFYDITTLLKDKKGYATLVDALAAHYIGVEDVDLVLGIEARGFIFGPGPRLPPECRLRAGAQAGQAACGDGARDL